MEKTKPFDISKHNGWMREPDEGRLSRPVLLETEGEAPSVYLLSTVFENVSK